MEAATLLTGALAAGWLGATLGFYTTNHISLWEMFIIGVPTIILYNIKALLALKLGEMNEQNKQKQEGGNICPDC